MKIKDFFTKSDRRVENINYSLYLMYQLLAYVPNDWEDIDGNVIPMDFLTTENWRSLEREYFHNYSPTKETSVLLDEMTEDEHFGETAYYIMDLQDLAKDIATRYMEGWCRAWYAYQVKYRPLDNYDGSEKTISNGYERKITSDSWDTNKEDATTNSGSSGVYGFNSSSSVPAGTSSSTTTPANTLSGRMADMPTNVHAINEGSNTRKETVTGNLETLKHGNLGVTTSQQMLQSELDFRANYNFYKLMFDNIDEVLTAHYYGGGC